MYTCVCGFGLHGLDILFKYCGIAFSWNATLPSTKHIHTILVHTYTHLHLHTYTVHKNFSKPVNTYTLISLYVTLLCGQYLSRCDTEIWLPWSGRTAAISLALVSAALFPCHLHPPPPPCASVYLQYVCHCACMYIQYVSECVSYGVMICVCATSLYLLLTYVVYCKYVSTVRMYVHACGTVRVLEVFYTEQ